MKYLQVFSEWKMQNDVMYQIFFTCDIFGFYEKKIYFYNTIYETLVFPFTP